MNDILSLRRMYFLLKGDLAANMRSLLVISATLSAVMFVSALFFLGETEGTGNFYSMAFTIMLFVFGIVASSRAFLPLHDKTRNEAFLLLPATALEKTLASLLGVTVGIVIYLLVFSTLISVLVETLNGYAFGSRHAYFNPLDPVVWDSISFYVWLQSLYFLGAAWFRRAHFVKTTFFIALVLSLLAMLALIAFRSAHSDPWSVAWDLSFVFEPLHHWLTDAAMAILFGVILLLPIACWTIAWLRVAEAQTSDAV